MSNPLRIQTALAIASGLGVNQIDKEKTHRKELAGLMNPRTSSRRNPIKKLTVVSSKSYRHPGNRKTRQSK